MKTTVLAIAATLLSGSIAYSSTASAAAILFDEASNLPTPSPLGTLTPNAQALEESNSPLVSWGNGFNPTGTPVASPETSTSLGHMSINGSYADAAGASSLGGIGSSSIFSYNIYGGAYEGNGLSDTLLVTLTNTDGTNIGVSASFYSGSLSSLIPSPLIAGTVTTIYETGFVQTALDGYGLQVQFRSDVTPIPAAVFFVAPALAGVFGFSRWKHTEA